MEQFSRLELRRLMAAGIALCVVACQRSGTPSGRADTASTGAGGVAAGEVPLRAPDSETARPHRDVPGGDSVAAAMRQWTIGAVDTALRRAGARDVAAAGAVRQPFFAVAGTRFTFTGGEMQLYLYGDAVARGRDTDGLDSARAAPPTVQALWRMPPTLIMNNNLVAILLTRDTVLRGRVVSRLTGHDRETGAAVALHPPAPVSPRPASPR